MLSNIRHVFRLRSPEVNDGTADGTATGKGGFLDGGRRASGAIILPDRNRVIRANRVNTDIDGTLNSGTR